MELIHADLLCSRKHSRWSEDGVEGFFRFVKRLWAFHVKNLDFLNVKIILMEINPKHRKWSKIKSLSRNSSQASYDMDRFQFNTVLATETSQHHRFILTAIKL